MDYDKRGHFIESQDRIVDCHVTLLPQFPHLLSGGSHLSNSTFPEETETDIGLVSFGPRKKSELLIFRSWQYPGNILVYRTVRTPRLPLHLA